ncbi:MAG: NAD(P)/FAD-dependent oxidoreductase [Ilumatobacteraceae bacterium]
MDAPSDLPRVVIVGAGFGGLAVARALRGAPVSVLLVDANNFHTFQPLLYQVATAGLDGDEISQPVRAIVRRSRRHPGNVRVRMARVHAVDIDARTVRFDDGDAVGYDTLVLAAGAVAHHFDVDGVVDHAVVLEHLSDALALRARILDAFERAAADPALVADGVLDVVVCGGGATGVELAGALRELYDRVPVKDFPELPVEAARIVLIEQADRLLAPFHPNSSRRARRTLERRGVEVRLGVGVVRVGTDRVELTDGSVIRAGTTVWSTGVRAEPLASTLGTPTGPGDRLIVEPDLTVHGHPDVFAIGDIALMTDRHGKPLPQLARPAMQAGAHVGEQIVRRLEGRPTEPFRFHDRGQMATIGRHSAVTELPGGLRFGGPLGWLSWLGLHLVYLVGFRNRLNVFLNWTWNYLTYDRGSRILREQERRADVAARQTGDMRG